MKRIMAAFSGVFVASVIFLIVTMFVFIKAQVPTASMYPTIQLNDKLLISVTKEVSYRGEIMVFDSEELGLTLVKRAIGLPNDLVEIKEGVVFVNGEELEEPYVENHSYENAVFEVPENCYLFLGDNRSESADSRFWENPYIHEDSIIGSVCFRYYPYIRLGFIQ